VGDGFTVALDELQRVGDSALPMLRDIMGAQLPVLNAYEGLAGPGTLDASTIISWPTPDSPPKSQRGRSTALKS
jgi:hypothetical protein